MAKRIESRGALDIAKRSLQTGGQIMRFAVAHGVIERNPSADVKPSDALKPRRKENYARLDAKQVPELLRKIEAYQGGSYTRLAMKLMAYTFVRTDELIAARWEEFDLEASEWRIPASRMKMRLPHIVPLAPQAIEVLQALQALSSGRSLLFPGERDHDRPMSNNTILAALKRIGYVGRMTGHGFRGIAFTILHEQGYPHHLIELQLVRTRCVIRWPRPTTTPRISQSDRHDEGLGCASGQIAQRCRSDCLEFACSLNSEFFESPRKPETAESRESLCPEALRGAESLCARVTLSSFAEVFVRMQACPWSA